MMNSHSAKRFFKSFSPARLWQNGYLIDAVFRGGKSINHSDTVIESLTHIIKRIRNGYREDVPILILADAGFFDEDNFKALKKLNVAYILWRKNI
ncbi:MAG: hypothetical protein C0189_00680 [Caldisericum exile]|uniref:Uncharacterized protein n=1 Tax=Caldisericum exile TaxID=693075 RepID=A0A2J6WFQ2_9BACT|nr:MAG: hypothetical protein C0189_00680 [Caldisericum exile]